MTKSLTENTWVYTDKGIEKVHWCNVYGVDELVTPKGKVLSPVPSYDEYKQLISKTEQLEKKLEIATEALKKYQEAINHFRKDPMNNIIMLAHQLIYDIDTDSKQAL